MHRESVAEPKGWLARAFHTLVARSLSLYVLDNDWLLDVRPLVSLRRFFRNYVVLRTADDPVAEQTLADSSELSPRSRYWMLNGTIHHEQDIQILLTEVAAHMRPDDRLILVYYSALWRPLLRLATAMRVRIRTPEQNWISPSDVHNLLLLAGLEPVRADVRLLCPLPVPGVAWLLNTWLAPLPVFRAFTVLNLQVARLQPPPAAGTPPSVSIVVPARNESGNIRDILNRCPRMGPDDELIFVEGNSSDDTWNVLQREVAGYQGPLRTRLVKQKGQGKGDAVRQGFSLAQNEVLMILDADLTVPPEELPKFYHALRAGLGELINGSRLIYPMEEDAMRFFNLVGNKFFAVGFSYVLGQRIKDTLCGTKVIWRRDYLRLAAHRSYFGDFDPFGDFDLLFGAARLCLKIVEVPVRYQRRTYGRTNIQRWKHGWILLGMLMLAARKFRFL